METVRGVRVVLVNFRRAERQQTMAVEQELVRATGPVDLAPGDTASFRLVSFRLDDQWRAVALAPGTGRAAHWEPRGNYLFTVRAFGQGTAPDTKRYMLTFVDGTRVSFAPDGAAIVANFSTMTPPER